MRHFALFVMLVSLGLFAIGCGKTDVPSEDPTPIEDVTADADAIGETPPAEGEAEGEAKPAEGEAKPEGEAK